MKVRQHLVSISTCRGTLDASKRPLLTSLAPVNPQRSRTTGEGLHQLSRTAHHQGPRRDAPQVTRRCGTSPHLAILSTECKSRKKVFSLQSQPKSPVSLMAWLHEPAILRDSRAVAGERESFNVQIRLYFWECRLFLAQDNDQAQSRSS